MLLIEIIALFYNSGCLPGLNAKADEYRQDAITQCNADTISPGNVYDRNGELIVSYEDPKDYGKYSDPYAYTQVVGYTGYGDYRLLAYYKDTIYQTTDIDSVQGCSLTLTLDTSLQSQVLAVLEEEMDLSDKGSAIVMDAKTSEILAMVSLPAYDANNLADTVTEMADADVSKEAYYPVTHKGDVVPGSIFKVVTTVAMIDHGLTDYMAPDENFKIGTADIVDGYTAIGDDIGWYEGLARSSNDYFAHAGLELGGDKLTETAKRFLIGQDLELDFGSVKSSWELDSKKDIDVAYTSFGQGKTLITTVYGAMIAQTIANDGVMMKPYMVQEIRDDFDKTLQTGAAQILSEVTSKETADLVTSGMEAASNMYLSTVEGEVHQQTFEDYNIASKTGTGELGNQEKQNNAWVISFAPADDPQYVVVVNQCKTKKAGQDLLDAAAKIYEYLFEGKVRE